MKQLIGYCGLDCELCDARTATLNNDDELRAKTAKLWCEMNNTDQIRPEHINCLGCRADGVKTAFCDSLCQIRQCALNKGVETCGGCPEMERCGTVGQIHASAPEARDNLMAR